MSERFASLDNLSDRQSTVLAEVMVGRGRLPSPFKVWIHSPDLAQRMNSLGGFMTGGLSLTKREQEIVVLVMRHSRTLALLQKGDVRFALANVRKPALW